MEEKLYLTVDDIYKLLPVGKDQARKIAKELQEKAKEKGYFIPDTHKFLVPTKFFKKEIKL